MSTGKDKPTEVEYHDEVNKDSSDTPPKSESGVIIYLTRDQIKNADDIASEEVDVPEWGGRVLVWGLTGEERDMWEEGLLVEKRVRGRTTRETNLKNVRAKLVVASCRDKKGNKLFADSDVSWLGKKSAAALNRVFKVAQKLSGLTDDEVEELIEELGEDQSESSGTP